jgi:hypothetical protein
VRKIGGEGEIERISAAWTGSGLDVRGEGGATGTKITSGEGGATTTGWGRSHPATIAADSSRAAKATNVPDFMALNLVVGFGAAYGAGTMFVRLNTERRRVLR